MLKNRLKSVLILAIALNTGCFFQFGNKKDKTLKSSINEMNYQEKEISCQSEISFCEKDSDCIIVKETCCPCTVGGTMLSINKRCENFYNQKLANCIDAFCVGLFKCLPSPDVSCIENKCTLKRSS